MNLSYIAYYTCVNQIGNPMPVALFLLPKDAEEWLAQQEDKEAYTIAPATLPRSP